MLIVVIRICFDVMPQMIYTLSQFLYPGKGKSDPDVTRRDRDDPPWG